MHLTPEQVIEALDGQSGVEQARHLAGCVECAREVHALRETWGAVRADAASQPSPLFWEHFRARVNLAIDAQPSHPGVVGWLAGRWAWATGACAAAAVALAVVASVSSPAREVHVATAPADGPVAMPELASADDGSWMLVGALVEQLTMEEAERAGLVLDGSAERAAAYLSDEERLELRRLLEQALTGDPQS